MAHQKVKNLCFIGRIRVIFYLLLFVLRTFLFGTFKILVRIKGGIFFLFQMQILECLLAACVQGIMVYYLYDILNRSLDPLRQVACFIINFTSLCHAFAWHSLA